jgi:predicted outer membrane repeat protein
MKSALLRLLRRPARIHMKRCPTKPRRRTSFRPRLEVLEDRSLPSTYVVNNLGDTGDGLGNAGDLRYCITQANADADPSNVIAFQRGLSGTISLQDAEPTITKALSIKGPGAARLTIDGNSRYRVFHVAADTTAALFDVTVADGQAADSGGGVLNEGNLTLSGCTFARDAATMNGGAVMNKSVLTVAGCTFGDDSAGFIGGAVYNDATATVSRSTFTGNTARAAGGVYSSTTLALNDSTFDANSATQGFGGGVATLKDATLSNCVFQENTASLGGGAVYTLNSASNNFELTVTGCTFTGNSVGSSVFAQGGGAILNMGILAVSGSTFDGNTAGSGGGVYNGGVATLRDSTFSDNAAPGAFGSGGAVASSGFFNRLSVVNCTFAGNSAAFGGAVSMNAVGQGVSYSLADCTFNGNSATSEGGAVYDPGIASIVSCTISGNQVASTGHGGGVFEEAGIGETDLNNTIVAGNLRVGGGADDVSGAVDAAGSSYNLIGDGTGTNLVDGVNGNLVGSRVQPIKPRLGPLQNNGGPTQTMALLAGSPALNAGDPAQLGVADQRGVVRRGGVNIGAYQASASAFVLTAPATATAGTPFDLVVTAVDAFGQTAVGYTGTVTFATTDTHPAVVLPADYRFAPADAGTHSFAGVTTLVSAGSQTLTATDTATSSITGFATVTFNPAAAAHLVLRDSSNPVKGHAWSVIVTALDAYGNVATGYTGTVHFTSSDNRATLPADYTFTAADAGAHTFRVTFHRVGQQSLTVTDTVDTSIFGRIAVLVQKPGEDGQGQDGQ